MQDFQFYSPTRFVFGRGKENEAGEILSQAGATKVMLCHYGEGADYEKPIIERVVASLEKTGLAYVDFAGIQANPSADRSQEGVEIARAEGVDWMLPVGGGSVIDTAKYIAVGYYYEGDMWEDLYAGNGKVEKALPVCTINTLPGTGSEGSNSSVMGKGVLKRSLNDDMIRPKIAIMDPELAFTLPPFQTASAAVDIMAHAHERYFTITDDNFLTDGLGEAVIKTVIKYLPIALEDPTNYEARAQLHWASVLAHNDSCGVGRGFVDGTVHGIESEIGGMYHSAHGAGCACVTPAWMSYVWSEHPSRFVRYFEKVWGVENDPFDQEGMIKEGIKRIKDFYVSVGIPVHYGELGVKEEDIPTLASTVRRGPDGMAGHFKKLSTEDIINIYALMK